MVASTIKKWRAALNHVHHCIRLICCTPSSFLSHQSPHQPQAKLDIQAKKLELEQARVVRQHNEEYEVRWGLMRDTRANKSKRAKRYWSNAVVYCLTQAETDHLNFNCLSNTVFLPLNVYVGTAASASAARPTSSDTGGDRPRERQYPKDHSAGHESGCYDAGAVVCDRIVTVRNLRVCAIRCPTLCDVLAFEGSLQLLICCSLANTALM